MFVPGSSFWKRHGARSARILGVAAAAASSVVAAAALTSCDTSYGCTTNKECIDARGELHICKRAPGQSLGTCAKLTSAECQTVEGDWASDNAFIFGAVLPTTGPDRSTGLACENAIRLALEDFRQSANGLPPVPGVAGAPRRPLAFVGCSDMSVPAIGVTAARHLAEDVGVSAIIGPQWSGVTGAIASEVTIADNVLLISPSATAVSITSLDDKNLVWRTSPSDRFQAAAIAGYVAQLEARIRTERSLAPGDKIRVVLLYQGTTYGIGLQDSLAGSLRINNDLAFGDANKPYFKVDNFGEPTDPALPAKAEEAVNTTLDFQPHLVINLCTNEGVTMILQPVEAQWTAHNPSVAGPFWILGDGGKIPELWNGIGTNNDLRRRTSGTVPGSLGDLFTSFEQKYAAKNYNDGTSAAALGPAGSYDSVYLLAYSAVANGAKPLTGPNLASGFAALVPGPQIPSVAAGANGINSTFNTLAMGGAIDFNGASGPLDFDLQSGEAPSDIQIWCIPKNPANGQAVAAESSGLYLDASSMQMRGAVASKCN